MSGAAVARKRALPRDPASVALARRTVEQHAGALSAEQLEVARLLVSELVTNAVRHGGGDEVVLAVRLDAARARFEVHDEGGERARRRAPAGADGGYGLNLVASLASRWGADPHSGVWFELDRAPPGGRSVGEPAGPFEGIRSALAPRRWSRWLAGAAAATVALAVLDVALGRSALVTALLVLPALVCALLARWGDTAVVAGLALALAGATVAWNDSAASTEVAALAVVAIGGALAVLVALLRAGAEVNLRRFHMLSAVADVGNEAITLDGAVARLLDMLAPAFADACVLDATQAAGGDRRVAIRPRGAEQEVEEALGRGPATTRLVLPLRARGRTIGTLSTLLRASGRSYSPSDVAFAEVFAGRAAVVLDNAGLTSELDAAERQLGTVLDELAEAVTVMDTSGRAVYANDAAVALLRLRDASELIDAPPGATMDRFEVYDEDGVPVELRRLPGFRALAGEQRPEPLLVRNVVKATGEERWLLNKTTSITDASGRVVRVVNVIEDVTETKRSELAQRLLAEASDALAASLDYESTLQRVAEVAVPTLADWCGVDVPGPDGAAQPVALAHADPGKVALGRRLRAAYPVRLDEPDGMAAVLRGAPTFVQSEIPDEALVAYARDEQHLELLRAIGFAAVLVVPIVAGGQALGALTLVRSTPGRPFDDTDVQLAEELGRRAGTAVLNARVYTERSAIAATLQRGLLPPVLQAPPGFTIATHYEAAGSMNEVGGDFYDAFTTPDGWMLVVGDVAGHGAEAAALTALARYTLRSAGQLTRDPGRAAHQLNATLRDLPQLSLCTTVCAQLRPDGSDARTHLTFANCGHPQPLLLRDGRIEELGGVGPMAGAFDAGEWVCTDVELHADDVLVLYTDGVLDTVGASERFGHERLLATLAAGPPHPDAVVSRVADALEAFREGPQRDDVAVVALGFGVHA